MDTNRLPEMSIARRLGLALLLGQRQSDDLLAYRVAQLLAATTPCHGVRAA